MTKTRRRHRKSMPRLIVTLILAACLFTMNCVVTVKVVQTSKENETEAALDATTARMMVAESNAIEEVLEEMTNVNTREITEEMIEETIEEATEHISIAEENHDAVQAMIEAVAKTHGAVGIQVAVIEGGVVTDTYAYGWATVNETEMTADHKIRIASISKVVVGMAAMLLQEEGCVNLDTDIGQYWDADVTNPYYPDDPITIRTILNHTSSIIGYGDDYSTDYTSVLYRLKNGGFSALRPGATTSRFYNNYAFRVLGMTLELAAQECLDNILDSRLFKAMQIDASFASGDIEMTDMLVTLYRENGLVARSVETQKNLHLSTVPGANGVYYAGGLTISCKDLAKLIALLANDGVYEGMQLMQGESVAQMEEYSYYQLSDGSYQALPLYYFQQLYGREEIYAHTGIAYGVYSCASYDPLTGDGVVVLTTGASGAAGTNEIAYVCDEINAYIYQLLADGVSAE